MYKYETHLHTSPVSKCGLASVRESLEFYKKLGFDGVFITNHFLDGNINIDADEPYEKKIDFYFSDYENGVKIGKELGIKVFLGIELTYKGTDFLIYGLDKEWFYNNPQIMDMKKSDELKLMMDSGAYVVQAHPYREDYYIDHIRLFPRSVHAVEVVNAGRDEFTNRMARLYAENYGLQMTAGSDNHTAGKQKNIAGMMCAIPIADEKEFIDKLKNGELEIFEMENTL